MKRTSTYRTMTSAGRICPFPLWLRTWFSWWLPPCWRTSISISSVISAKRSSHWKRQADWKPLSYILSACQQNGCELEGRTFWTYIQIKHTTPKFSLNKQRFFVAFIFPIGLGGGFYAPARANTSLRSLPFTCRGKKTPQYTKSSHKKKCCGIKEPYLWSRVESIMVASMESIRWSSESRSQACLGYSDSWQRKVMPKLPHDWKYPSERSEFFRDLSCFLSATISVGLGTKDLQTTKF